MHALIVLLLSLMLAVRGGHGFLLVDSWIVCGFSCTGTRVLLAGILSHRCALLFPYSPLWSYPVLIHAGSVGYVLTSSSEGTCPRLLPAAPLHLLVIILGATVFPIPCSWRVCVCVCVCVCLCVFTLLSYVSPHVCLGMVQALVAFMLWPGLAAVAYDVPELTSVPSTNR